MRASSLPIGVFPYRIEAEADIRRLTDADKKGGAKRYFLAACAHAKVASTDIAMKLDESLVEVKITPIERNRSAGPRASKMRGNLRGSE